MSWKSGNRFSDKDKRALTPVFAGYAPLNDSSARPDSNGTGRALVAHPPPARGNVAVGLDHRGAAPVDVEAQRAGRADENVARAGVVRLLAHDLIAVGRIAEWPVHQRSGACVHRQDLHSEAELAARRLEHES